VTKKEGIPVFHKVFDGNVHDSRTFSDTLTSFREYNIKNGLIIFDRGISSKDNQQGIFALKWKVLCGLPLNPQLKKLLRDSVNNDSFITYKNRIKLNKTIFYTMSQPYSITPEINGTLVFCFNEQLKKDIRESRFDEIYNAQVLLVQRKKIKPELEKYFSKNRKLVPGKLKDAEEFDGFSCIFSTAKIAKDKMVKMYFDKDLVEKAFQSLKGIVKVRPIRHWLYNRVIAHVFVCYLSYLLLSLLKYRLEKIEMSPVEALKELDSLYRVYLRDSKKDFQLSRMVTLNKKQEKILRCIDKKLLTKCSV